MKPEYIFLVLPFLISFMSAQGVVNDNHYIKQFAFQFIFVIMFVFYIVRGNRFLNCGTKVSLADLCVSGLLTTYLYFCFGTYNVIDHSLPITYCLFYFFIRFYGAIHADNIIDRIALLVIAMHIIICGLQYVSILPNYNSYFKVASAFGNPDMLGAYLAVLLPFCYTCKTWRMARYSIFGLTILLLFLLQARTAIVATAVPLLIYCIRIKSISLKYGLTGAIIILVGFIFLAMWHYESVLGRVFIWIVSLSMMIQKPFGWGVYAFEKYYPECQSDFILNHPAIVDALNVDVVHASYNEFLNIGVTLGITGLLFYVLFVIYILKLAYKAKSPLLFPLLAVQIISLSYFSFKIVPVAVIYILFCAMTINADREYAFSIKTKLVRLLSFSMILPVLTYFVCNLYSFIYWREAVILSKKKETYTEACNPFDKCYPFLKHNGRFLLSYADLKYKMHDMTTTFCLMKQADSYFSDIAFLHNLAILFEKNGNISEAKRKFDIAVNMLPYNAEIAYAQISFLRRIGEVEEAYRLALIWSEKLAAEPLKSKYALALAQIKKFISSYHNYRYDMN